MTKKKSRDELEHLRGVNRSLLKQIRKLQNQLSRKEKREHLFEDKLEEEAEKHLEEDVQEIVKLTSNECPKCKGKLDPVEIGNRLIINCKNCNYRTSKKIT